jgi:hypothetical protein
MVRKGMMDNPLDGICPAKARLRKQAYGVSRFGG